MILISCIDARGGLLFHGRRLSRDRVLCQDVLRTCAGSPLWMAPGSRSLFSSLRDGLSSSILTSEDFLAQAALGWSLLGREEFPGSSHKKITKEVYRP